MFKTYLTKADALLFHGNPLEVLDQGHPVFVLVEDPKGFPTNV